MRNHADGALHERFSPALFSIFFVFNKSRHVLTCAKAASHLEEEAFRKRGPPTSEVCCEAFVVLPNSHNSVFEKKVVVRLRRLVYVVHPSTSVRQSAAEQAVSPHESAKRRSLRTNWHAMNEKGLCQPSITRSDNSGGLSILCG